jgi:hypothetical protein
MSAERGIALLLAILVTSFLSAIGLGLALIVVMDRMATGNLRGSIAMLYTADAALELAARDLLLLEDWTLALAGQARGSVTDGDPSGVRAIPGGGTIDLTAAGNELNCGRAGSCSNAQMSASTRERPWGMNNGRWRLFAFGPVRNFVQSARPTPGYLTVWIADDGREQDGDPERDGGPDEPGHHVLRVRVHAYGPLGARRAIEAELARLCLDVGDPCREGIRVQSWQEVREGVP